MIFSPHASYQLQNGLEKIGIPISSETVATLVSYWSLVEETNRTLNLTRVVGDEAVTHHLLDAASLYPCIKEINPKTAIDIGTGLGIPGIVLAVLFPNIQFTLLDALDKRIQFLKVVIDKLSLRNVTALHGRGEELGKKEEFRAAFDIALSRAVTALPALLELSLPLVSKGGAMLAMKGPKVYEEVQDANVLLPQLGGQEIVITALTVPHLQEERYVVTAKKVNDTEDKFPRKPNKLGKI